MQEPGLLLGESQLVFALLWPPGWVRDMALLLTWPPWGLVCQSLRTRALSGAARSGDHVPGPTPSPLLAAPSQPAPPWSSLEGLGEGLCAFLLGLCQLSPLQGLGARQLGAGLC